MIEVSLEELHHKLIAVGGMVATNKSRMPVLNTICVETIEGATRMIAGDEVTFVMVPLTAEASEDGALLLPAVVIRQIVSEAMLSGAKTITIDDSERGAIRVTYSGAEFYLLTPPPEDYPRVAFPNVEYHTIESIDLLEGLRSVEFASEKARSARHATEGVLFDTQDNRITLAATDTRRLAVAYLDTKGVATGHQQIVPKKPLKLMDTLVAKMQAETVGYGSTTSEAVFLINGAVLTTRLVEGKFPRYQVMQQENLTDELTVKCSDIQKAVRQASIMTDRASPTLVIDLLPDSDTLRFSCDVERMLQDGTEKHDNSIVELAVKILGKPLTARFRANYLQQYLDTQNPDAMVDIRYIDEQHQFKFSCGVSDYHLMPTAKQ